MSYKSDIELARIKIEQAESLLKEAKEALSCRCDGTSLCDKTDSSPWTIIMKNGNDVVKIKDWGFYRHQEEMERKERTYRFLKELTDKYPLLLELNQIRSGSFQEYHAEKKSSKWMILDSLIAVCRLKLEGSCDRTTWFAMRHKLEVFLENLNKKTTEKSKCDCTKL